MALKLKPTESTEFELPSEGSHQAVCVAVVDLGTQENTYEGTVTVAHKVYLAFELAGDTKEDGSPFVVGRDYTFSLNEKAALRQVAKALRGKDVGPDEEIDLRGFLKKPCIVALEAKQTGAGKNYVKLSGVTPPMKGTKPAACRLEPVYWEIDSGEEFPEAEWLPYLYGTPLRKVLEASAEWKGQGAKDDTEAF
jgi:hypothetical protein